MKEAFDHLKQIFPPMPNECDNALMQTVEALRDNPQRARPMRSARRIVILVAIMLSVTCAASAAFYPRIIDLFTGFYGQWYGERLKQGNLDTPNATLTNGGVIYTLDEVLVTKAGLYMMGSIRGENGVVVVDYDCSADEPWGYNIHYGETAPEGTPSIAEKAKETGSVIRYVSCFLDAVGVDDGEARMPDCYGYGIQVQRDGSIVFSMEVEDGELIKPGKTYTLSLYVRSYGANADGSINHEDRYGQEWLVSVTPTMNPV